MLGGDVGEPPDVGDVALDRRRVQRGGAAARPATSS
jgi:hypothetical protein